MKGLLENMARLQPPPSLRARPISHNEPRRLSKLALLLIKYSYKDLGLCTRILKQPTTQMESRMSPLLLLILSCVLIDL